jgi:hypothetical protein
MNQEGQECFPESCIMTKSITGKKADGSNKKDTDNPGKPNEDKEDACFHCIHGSNIYELNKRNFLLTC